MCGLAKPLPKFSAHRICILSEWVSQGCILFSGIKLFPVCIRLVSKVYQTSPNMQNRKKMRNNLLNEEPVYTGKSKTPTHLHLHNYSESGRKTFKTRTFTELLPPLKKEGMHWLQVFGLNHTNTIREICEYYHFNFLILQDILNSGHPVKIEEHPTFYFLVLKLLHNDEKENELVSQQVYIIQGKDFLITFQEQESDFFDPVVQALHENVLDIRTRGSDYLLSVLLNQLMASYNGIVNDISEALEDMEEELLDITGKTDIGKRIQAYRRKYLVLKKAIMPLKEQYLKLQHTQSSLIREENLIFFNDVGDHLQLASQTVDICREMLASLADLYISNNDLRMNDVMKRLTAVSTVFIPLTFVVGVWGMNFRFMPELEWEYGYITAWVIMIVIAIAVSVYLKKKDWY